ncbi:hypothetical protein PHYBOEH_009292 [Phytophthora boehmeriae]|uniref:S-adenosyl-L-methionine-dependent methyltransferase n=1 Tax=Phytophthora boehmeriae TaxID=109152 RepID=A0A8T1X5C2_9STRA|nr:hypothetical protein PHYBOEH_009292 [Phytophthora boehmeriae]
MTGSPPAIASGGAMQYEDFAQFMGFLDARLRAIEYAREDHLIEDPFAEPLTRQIAPQLTPRLTKWQVQQPHPEDYIALRARYLDEAIANRNPNIRQVVFLGAGLDTRVFRLETLRGCHVLEIDQSAELFEHKRTIMKELKAEPITDRHNYIVADLNSFNWEESLLSSGFNPDIPTFWSLEGIMMYLNRASNVALLKTIDILSAPGSEVWSDMPGSILLKEGEFSLIKDVNDLCKTELGVNLFQYGEDDILDGVFTELPWQLEIQAALAEEGTHFGRLWTPTLTRVSKIPIKYNFVLAKKPAYVL